MNNTHKASLIIHEVRNKWANGHPDIEKYEDMEEHLVMRAIQESSCDCQHLRNRDKKINILENMLLHLKKDNERLKKLHDMFTSKVREWDMIRINHPELYKQLVFIWTGKTYEQIMKEKEERKKQRLLDSIKETKK